MNNFQSSSSSSSSPHNNSGKPQLLNKNNDIATTSANTPKQQQQLLQYPQMQEFLFLQHQQQQQQLLLGGVDCRMMMMPPPHPPHPPQPTMEMMEDTNNGGLEKHQQQRRLNTATTIKDHHTGIVFTPTEGGEGGMSTSLSSSLSSLSGGCGGGDDKTYNTNIQSFVNPFHNDDKKEKEDVDNVREGNVDKNNNNNSSNSSRLLELTNEHFLHGSNIQSQQQSCTTTEGVQEIIEHDITQLQLQKILLMKKLLQQQQQQQLIEMTTCESKKGGQQGGSSNKNLHTNPSSSTSVAAATVAPLPQMTMTTKQEKSSTDLMAGEKGGGGGDVVDKGVAMGVAGGGKACEEVVPAAGHILHPTTMTCPLPTTNTSIVPVHAVTMSSSGGGLLGGVGKQHSNKNYVRDHGLPSVVEIKNGGGGGGSHPSELGTRRASLSSQGYKSQGGSNSNNQNSDGGYRAFGALVGSAFVVGNHNKNNYVAGQQQNFLDGHFAGGWQSNANLPDRRRMNFHIIKVIELMRPDANRSSQNRLILMAKKLEDHLYRSAHTKEEYVDLASLKRRLHLIAKANSIAGFNDGGEDGSNVSLAGSTGVLHIAGAGMIFNQNASTIKAMARTSWLQERHQQHNSVASFTDRQKQSNTSQNSISTMSRLLPHDISINSKDKLQRQEKKKLVLLDRVEIAATTAPAIVSKTGSSGDKSIPQLIGITLQSSQTCPRDDNCVPQQHAQQSVMIGMQPQTDDGNFRILQIELRKKQLTLTHVQQQMSNFFGQSQKLQHQLSMSASNLQQAQQLTQQEIILGQLNHQYEQQQLILQSEIMHHIFLIQQYEQRNALSTVSNVTISSKRYMNGNEVDESHISKKTKPLSVAEQCLPILMKLINHEHGWVFKDPVDPVELGIPDYFDIVKHPMDLNLVMKKLECGSYTDIKSFERDTKLVFTNAILFNGDESDVGCMAKELLDILVVDLKGDKYRKPAM